MQGALIERWQSRGQVDNLRPPSPLPPHVWNTLCSCTKETPGWVPALSRLLEGRPGRRIIASPRSDLQPSIGQAAVPSARSPRLVFAPGSLGSSNGHDVGDPHLGSVEGALERIVMEDAGGGERAGLRRVLGKPCRWTALCSWSAGLTPEGFDAACALRPLSAVCVWSSVPYVGKQSRNNKVATAAQHCHHPF